MSQGTILPHARKYHSLTETGRLSIAKEFAVCKLDNYISMFKQRYDRNIGPVIGELQRYKEYINQAGDIKDLKEPLQRGYTGYSISSGIPYPYMGFLHSPEDRFGSLLCDIQELFIRRLETLQIKTGFIEGCSPCKPLSLSLRHQNQLFF